MVEPTPADALVALQNRINDLSVGLDELKKFRAESSYVEKKDLDARIAEFKIEIESLKTAKKEIKEDPKSEIAKGWLDDIFAW